MKLQLSAIDTWFFRDGTPFDKEGSPQSGVVGMFPPYPPTVAGAIRAALARRNGWDGRGRWRGGELAAVLGDGPADLGRLRITGPFVLRGGTPMFPMPRHVVGRVEEGSGAWVPAALMRPGGEIVPSDLGPSVRLPELERDVAASAAGGAKPGAGGGRWVTLEGLRQILRGEPPRAAEVVQARALWTQEGRVGIARTPGSRIVADGALYSTLHARPAPGTSLGAEIDGVPPSWNRPVGDMIPLGGESRLAVCEAWDGQAEIDFDGPRRDARTAAVVALTPVLLGDGELAFPGARIVSACVDRPLRIGGWDSGAGGPGARGPGAPRPLRNAAPPGSVWFCELEDVNAFHAALTGGRLRAGDATAMGFGLCAVGGAPLWERTT